MGKTSKETKKINACLTREVTVSVREQSFPYDTESRANDPAKVVVIARSIFEQWSDEKERAVALLFNAKRQLIGYNLVSVGTIDASFAHPREVFRPAIVAGAKMIVMIHNHPSGNADPSRDDGMTERRLREAGEIIGIEVSDNIILGDGEYYSFAAGGKRKE